MDATLTNIEIKGITRVPSNNNNNDKFLSNLNYQK